MGEPEVTTKDSIYDPHVQRPARCPPLDGHEPPEDPLRGVARQIAATAHLKTSFLDLVFVGSGYSTGFITLIETAVAGALAIALPSQRHHIPCESSTAKSSSAVPAGTSSR